MMWPFKKKLKISEKDALKIRKADWDTCVKWWDILNTWEWPEELLPEEKPSFPYNPNSRRRVLMNEIDRKVGRKFILMKLNTARDMTVEEFEDFWEGTHNYDQAAYKRYQDRVDEKYKTQTT